MTLGHVYDMDLKKNESLIKEVIIQAQGEVCILLAISGMWFKFLLVDGSGGIHQAGEGDLDELHS